MSQATRNSAVPPASWPFKPLPDDPEAHIIDLKLPVRVQPVSSGLVAAGPEDRLSGEVALLAGADHAAASRSSDGSGELKRPMSRLESVRGEKVP